MMPETNIRGAIAEVVARREKRRLEEEERKRTTQRMAELKQLATIDTAGGITGHDVEKFANMVADNPRLKDALLRAQCNSVKILLSVRGCQISDEDNGYIYVDIRIEAEVIIKFLLGDQDTTPRE